MRMTREQQTWQAIIILRPREEKPGQAGWLARIAHIMHANVADFSLDTAGALGCCWWTADRSKAFFFLLLFIVVVEKDTQNSVSYLIYKGKQ